MMMLSNKRGHQRTKQVRSTNFGSATNFAVKGGKTTVDAKTATKTDPSDTDKLTASRRISRGDAVACHPIQR